MKTAFIEILNDNFTILANAVDSNIPVTSHRLSGSTTDVLFAAGED
jgi:hypothetical protein